MKPAIFLRCWLRSWKCHIGRLWCLQLNWSLGTLCFAHQSSWCWYQMSTDLRKSFHKRHMIDWRPVWIRNHICWHILILADIIRLHRLCSLWRFLCNWYNSMRRAYKIERKDMFQEGIQPDKFYSECHNRYLLSYKIHGICYCIFGLGICKSYNLTN